MSIPLWEHLWSWGPKRFDTTRPYQPKSGGSFFYAPPQIHCLALRNNHLDVVETQMSESDTNKLTRFDEGTSTVTLHFCRVRSQVIFT